MSPEQMSVGKISKASDVYSFGITIYEVCRQSSSAVSLGPFTHLQIFTGDPPFAYMPTDLLRINVVDRKSRPIRPTDKAVTERGLDNAMWALAEACWSHEPLARPTADSVASRLHSIWLTSLRTEPEFGTDESSSMQGTLMPNDRDSDWVFTDQDLIIACVSILNFPFCAQCSSFPGLWAQLELLKAQ
jgi:serine/threonine protein kinase